MAATIDGELCLVDVKTGLQLSSAFANGKVFSSPTITSKGRVIVGSRDDYLYCFALI